MAVGGILESISHYGNSGRVIPVSIYGKLAAALGVAAIIGLASWGGVAYAAAGRSATLTTAQITARTNPAWRTWWRRIATPTRPRPALGWC
jgi:hypothetical protein